MRKMMILFVAIALTSAALAEERIDNYSGKQADIEAAIVGKVCRSEDGDIARFDKLKNGVREFHHADKPTAYYALGYGTLEVRRGEAVHGHVVSVHKNSGLFHFGGKAYVCK